MKRLIVLFLLICSGVTGFAQQKDIATATFKVSGNCSMCKKRIEEAAYAKGVKLAEWDKSKQVLVVTYRPSKTSPEQIQQQVAKAGHDAGTYTASDADYGSIPDCCAYRTVQCSHE